MKLHSRDFDLVFPADATGNAETCLADATGREVTMRGDLEQMSLADIFQSLGMSKMEGILRVKNLVELREIYFRDGQVRSFVPARTEVRRLGTQLLQAGLVTESQLGEIVGDLRREGKTLKELLIEYEVLPENDVEQLVDHHSSEDLLGLFTWEHGTFEFYKGPPEGDAVIARLEQIPEHDISTVLMEVARRSDEWEIILERVHSLDEIFVPTAAAPDKLAPDSLEVLQALDGQRSLREVALAMLAGLFEVSRIVRDLVRSGHADFAPVEHCLDIARAQVESDNKRAAIVTLDTVVDRRLELGYADLSAIAALYQMAGEPRRAGQTLLTAARDCEDPGQAVEIMRDARALLPRSAEVLQQLRVALVNADDEELLPELIQVTDDLCAAQLEDGRYELALETCTELEQLRPDDPRTTFRKAVILHRLGSKEEAIELLLEVAETYKLQGRRPGLISVYEQILKIDSRRKDVVRALRGLHRNAAAWRMRLIALAGGIILAGLAGLIAARASSDRTRIAAAERQLAALLDKDDVDGANRFIENLEPELHNPQALDVLRAAVDAHVAGASEAKRRAILEQFRVELGQAASKLLAGEYVAALDLYASLAARGPHQASEVRSIVRVRFETMLTELEQTARSLRYALPQTPDLTLTGHERREALAALRQSFPDNQRARFRALSEVTTHPFFAEATPTDFRLRLAGVAREIDDLYAAAQRLETGYRRLEAQLETHRRLQPLFLAAKTQLAQFRFHEALENFRVLARDHPTDDELKQLFVDETRRLTQITKILDAANQASAKGDYETARAGLRMLTELDSTVPFAKIVRLPMAVLTSPPGAKVFVGGENVGTSPCLLQRLPAQALELRVDLHGFFPATTKVEGEFADRVHLVLTRRPKWVYEAAGAVQHAPASDGKSLFVVDRAGHIAAVDLATGKQRWSRATGDASGLLPRPAVAGDKLLVASVDGMLRCFTAADGSLGWSRGGIPAEADPILHDGQLLVATNHGRLVALDAQTGRQLGERALPGPCAVTPAVCGETLVCATAAGEIVALELPGCGTRWQHRLGEVVLTAPTAIPGGVVIATAEGRVVCIDPATGQSKWQVKDVPTLAVPPVHLDGSVWIACDDGIRSYAADSGASGKVLAVPSTVSSLGALDDLLFRGDSDGRIVAIDPRTGGPCFQLRGEQRCWAPVLRAGDATIAVFQGRQVHAYAARPQ